MINTVMSNNNEPEKQSCPGCSHEGDPQPVSAQPSHMGNNVNENLMEFSDGEDVSLGYLTKLWNVTENVQVGVLADIGNGMEINDPWVPLVCDSNGCKAEHKLALESWQKDYSAFSLNGVSEAFYPKVWLPGQYPLLDNLQTGDIANKTREELFSLRVFVGNGSIGKNMDMRVCKTMNFWEYTGPVHDDKTRCLIHITRYNSEKKKDVEYTMITEKFSGSNMKYLAYCWDPNLQTWRLMNSLCTEMGFHQCFTLPNSIAQTVYSEQGRIIEKTKFLSKPMHPIEVPLYMEKFFTSQIDTVIYNFKLEVIRDMSIIRVKGDDGKIRYYQRDRI